MGWQDGKGGGLSILIYGTEEHFFVVLNSMYL